MSTVIEICNDALANIRAQSINSLDDPSLQAQYCKLKYPIARNKVLREFNWNFATRTQALALRTELLPAWGYTYAYPSDCLKIQLATPENVFTINDSVPFEVTTVLNGTVFDRVIGSNTTNMFARFTYIVDNPILFDSLFSVMLSWYLSSVLAVPLLGEGKGIRMSKYAEEKYDMLLQSALKNDDEEGEQEQPTVSELITGRS